MSAFKGFTKEDTTDYSESQTPLERCRWCLKFKQVSQHTAKKEALSDVRKNRHCRPTCYRCERDLLHGKQTVVGLEVAGSEDILRSNTFVFA